MNVLVSGKTFSLDPTKKIGEGGEAEVFDIGGGKVVKYFKPPTHITFRDSKESQEAARKKIAEHQKKLPAFPKNMPSRIVGPSELAKDPASGKIVGYVMPYISGYESLFSLSQRIFREAAFDDKKVVTAFQDLHMTVTAAHKQRFVFGDFNDLNGLVKPDGTEVLMLDADSAQFGGYHCLLFTNKFVDPLLAALNSEGNAPVLRKPHNEHSDWYAFALMLMQSWLYVGPYGGVYRPTGARAKVSHDARSLHRITVWDGDVKYPKPARPLSDLPTDVAGYLESVFRTDKREPFPVNLLESLSRKAQGILPDVTVPVQPNVTHHAVRGMKADRLFQTVGKILHVTNQGKNLSWIYEQEGAIFREGGRRVLTGKSDRTMRYRISGEKTIIAMGQTALIFEKDGSHSRLNIDMVTNRSVVDSNGEDIFTISRGELLRHGVTALGPQQEVLGRFIENQTVFWVGDDLGFGFYRAGNLCMYFMFSPSGKNVKDTLELPPIKGLLIDATVTFGNERIWFLVATQENSKRINRCYVLDERGVVLGNAEATDGDGSWLSTIRGKSAMGKSLFAATDDGVVRVELHGSALAVTKEFPETTKFVNSGSMILAHKSGIAVVTSGEIWNLTMG